MIHIAPYVFKVKSDEKYAGSRVPPETWISAMRGASFAFAARTSTRLSRGLRSENRFGAEKRCGSRGHQAADPYDEPYVVGSTTTSQREEHDGAENGNRQGNQRRGDDPAPRKQRSKQRGSECQCQNGRSGHKHRTGAKGRCSCGPEYEKGREDPHSQSCGVGGVGSKHGQAS